MLLEFDRSAELGRLGQPTLIIGARDDALIPIHHARRLRGLIGHAEYCELEGAHFHPRTDPEPFAARVAAFLLSAACAASADPGRRAVRPRAD